MKIILTLINIVSVVPILLYPVIFISGAMMFDAPNSTKSVMSWTIFVLSVVYPLLIIALIFFSRKYNSVLLALLALIPLIILLYVFFVSGGTKQKDAYNTLNKDFICDSNSFLNISGKKGNPVRTVYFFEKKNFFTYKKNLIATVYEDTSINVSGWLREDIVSKNSELLRMCKNTEGKSMLDVFNLVDDSFGVKERDVLKSRKEVLDKEFILKIGEVVTIEDVELFVLKNIIRSTKDMENTNEGNGIRVKVTRNNDAKTYDFLDGKVSRIDIDGGYMLKLIDRVPGQGTFVLYKI